MGDGAETAGTSARMMDVLLVLVLVLVDGDDMDGWEMGVGAECWRSRLGWCGR